VGPFPNENGAGVEASYPPEKDNFDPNQEFEGKNGQKLRWQERDYPDGRKHDMKDHFEDANNLVFYLRRTIRSERAGTVRFWIGSDDDCRIWVNRQMVHEHRGGRGVKEYEDTFQAVVQQGENELLFKVCQGGGDTGFFFTDQAPSLGGNPFQFSLEYPAAR
jgi:hypothetical protein